MSIKEEIRVQNKVSEYYEDVRYKRKYSILYQRGWSNEMLKLAPANGLILDNGCGTGNFLSFLNSNKAVGIDKIKFNVNTFYIMTLNARKILNLRNQEIGLDR